MYNYKVKCLKISEIRISEKSENEELGRKLSGMVGDRLRRHL